MCCITLRALEDMRMAAQRAAHATVQPEGWCKGARGGVEVRGVGARLARARVGLVAVAVAARDEHRAAGGGVLDHRQLAPVAVQVVPLLRAQARLSRPRPHARDQDTAVRCKQAKSTRHTQARLTRCTLV